MRRAVPGRAAHDLRGVLRSARARVRPRRDRRGRLPQARRGLAADPVALRAAAARRARRPARRPRRRVHAAATRRPARRAPGPSNAVGEGRQREPVELLQGPRRDRRHDDGPGVRVRGDELRVDRQPRERDGRRRRQGRDAVLRVRARRPRAREDPRHRGLRRQGRRGEGQLRRREPAVHRGRRGAALGLREREHAPVLRRGLQVARLRGGRAARLAPPRPRRRADRQRRPDDQGAPRVPRARRDRRGRRSPLPHQRRPGRGLLAGRPGVRRRRRRGACP